MEQNQMSKFCIDLEGVMLPDAIAAVVEAWYDAQIEEKQSTMSQKINLIDQELSMHVIDSIIGTLNQSPKIKGSRLAIERRGQKLAIRGRLPLKSNPSAYVYQRISLGIPVDEHNIKVAEIVLLLIKDQLNRNDFNWIKWSDDQYIEGIVSNASLIINPVPAVV
jgi:hypothetical protein